MADLAKFLQRPFMPSDLNTCTALSRHSCAIHHKTCYNNRSCNMLYRVERSLATKIVTMSVTLGQGLGRELKDCAPHIAAVWYDFPQKLSTNVPQKTTNHFITCQKWNSVILGHFSGIDLVLKFPAQPLILGSLYILLALLTSYAGINQSINHV